MLVAFVRKLHRQGRLGGALKVLEHLRLLGPAFRLYEKLVARDRGSQGDEPIPIADETGPIPPPDLMVLVQGSADTEWFRISGQAIFDALVGLARKHDAPVENMRDILEFGCGCGRVLRHWRAVSGPQIHGTDYNPKLLDWCRVNLPFSRISQNGLAPPLAFPDSGFDFIYAISVFTHLSEDLQARWMTELTRILRPGGLLLITTHGTSFHHKLDAAEQARFDSGKLVVRYADSSGQNLCNAYHPETWVRNRLATDYTILEFVPAGTWEAVYQDIYLLKMNRKVGQPVN